MSDPKTSRGYRNKNPGNLNYIADPKRAFAGQVGLGDAWLPEAQRRFGEYETHEKGIRALVAQLTVYQTRDRLRTIAQMIGKWAPGSENDTAAYVAAVSRRVGVAPTAPIDMRQYSQARPMVDAVIIHECGGMPYSAEQIDAGLALYGLTPFSEQRVTTVAEAAQTGTGRGAITVGTAAAAAATAAPAIQAMGGLNPWIGVALVLAAAAVAVAIVLNKRKAA